MWIISLILNLLPGLVAIGGFTSTMRGVKDYPRKYNWTVSVVIFAYSLGSWLLMYFTKSQAIAIILFIISALLVCAWFALCWAGPHSRSRAAMYLALPALYESVLSLSSAAQLRLAGILWAFLGAIIVYLLFRVADLIRNRDYYLWTSKGYDENQRSSSPASSRKNSSRPEAKTRSEHSADTGEGG